MLCSFLSRKRILSRFKLILFGLDLRLANKYHIIFMTPIAPNRLAIWSFGRSKGGGTFLASHFSSWQQAIVSSLAEAQSYELWIAPTASGSHETDFFKILFCFAGFTSVSTIGNRPYTQIRNGISRLMSRFGLWSIIFAARRSYSF